jgi:hypothetical protein
MSTIFVPVFGAAQLYLIVILKLFKTLPLLASMARTEKPCACD